MNRRSISHVDRHYLRKKVRLGIICQEDAAVILTDADLRGRADDPQIASFIRTSLEHLLDMREFAVIRQYHLWHGCDFVIVRRARAMRRPISSCAPVLHVSPGALYKAAQRNPQLAA